MHSVLVVLVAVSIASTVFAAQPPVIKPMKPPVIKPMSGR